VGVNANEQITIINFLEAGFAWLFGTCPEHLHTPHLLAETFYRLRCLLPMIDEIDERGTKKCFHGISNG
jgi:hypothetical protein